MKKTLRTRPRRELKFVKHASPQSLATANTTGQMKSVLPYICEMDKRDIEGFAENLGLRESWILDLIDMRGFHGFADPDEKIIHYYAAPHVSFVTLAYLLAHEAGHCVGEVVFGKDLNDDAAEEDRADTYSVAIGAVMAEMGFIERGDHMVALKRFFRD